jgi:hypothetical protein
MGCVPFIVDREVRDLPQMALERHCVLFTLVNMRLRARQEVGKTGHAVCGLAIRINMRLRARQEVGKTGYAVCGLTIRINMRLRARSTSEKGVNLSLQFGGAWFHGTINLKGGSGFFFFCGNFFAAVWSTSSPHQCCVAAFGYRFVFRLVVYQLSEV